MNSSYRTLDNQQSRSAEITGYQLLGDAFHAPKSDSAWHPEKNEQLKTHAPALGTVQSVVEQTGFTDPHHEAENLTHQAQSQINTTHSRMKAGEKAIDMDHAHNLKATDQQSSAGFSEMEKKKIEHFRAEIASAANNTPSAAEFSCNMLGGSVYNTAKDIEAAGSVGNEYVKQFIGGYQDATSKGADTWDAIKYAASQSYPGFLQATQTWADHRVNEVADKLTPSQQDYYRAAMFESFAGIAFVGDNSSSLGACRIIDMSV